MRNIFCAALIAVALLAPSPVAAQPADTVQVEEFRKHVDEGTVGQYLNDNPDLKAYLSDLRRVSDSGELAQAMQANPQTRQQLLDAGVITEENVLSPVLADLIPAQSTLDEQERSTSETPVADSEFTRETSTADPKIIYPTEVPANTTPTRERAAEHAVSNSITPLLVSLTVLLSAAAVSAMVWIFSRKK